MQEIITNPDQVKLYTNSNLPYQSMPIIYQRGADGQLQPVPFLMGLDELALFLRLPECNIRFHQKTIQRYRKMGLRSVRIGRRVWFRLDDVLRFMDSHQDRLTKAGYTRHRGIQNQSVVARRGP